MWKHFVYTFTGKVGYVAVRSAGEVKSIIDHVLVKAREIEDIK